MTRDRVEGGRHHRIATAQGVIHVWQPPGYRRKRAGIVVYVHGYHINADRTWRGHKLARQFRQSHQNALFIVVDGPTGPGERVKFPSLGKVLLLAARYARLRLPHGHIVAVGHSGGYRTVAAWLDYRYLSHVILLDALYGNQDEFHHWFSKARHHDWHRMTLVAKDTEPQVKRFLRRFQRKPAVVMKRIPEAYAEMSRRQRRARLAALHSQYGHSALVSNRKVLPILLRRTRLRLAR